MKVIEKAKKDRIWVDGCWHYDEFKTIMAGTLTSTPTPIDGVYREGEVYAVTLYGHNETLTKKFFTYADAHNWFCKVKFAQNVADALCK